MAREPKEPAAAKQAQKAEKRQCNGERDAQGRFLPGNKGGGRTPVPQEVKEILRGATPAAARLLAATVTDEAVDLKLRLDAAKTLLDRVYGKASQPLEGGLESGVRIILGEELAAYAG